METNTMYPKMEKIGDIFNLLNCDNPKKVIFDLSEDGEFYDVKIYIDIVNKSKNKKYEGYVTCKSNLSTVVDYFLIYDHTDRNAKTFTVTIPDEEE